MSSDDAQVSRSQRISHSITQRVEEEPLRPGGSSGTTLRGSLVLDVEASPLTVVSQLIDPGTFDTDGDGWSSALDSEPANSSNCGDHLLRYRHSRRVTRVVIGDSASTAHP